MPLLAIVGMEAAGEIIALPTHPEVLNHPEFKARCYAIGAKTIAVRTTTRALDSGSFALSAQNTRGINMKYIAIPWDKIYPIPSESEVDTRAGAPGLVQATAVLSFMNKAYPVKKGDTILIHTVAGGFGLIPARYAKFKGATMISTTPTDAKAELARRHGADHVGLYTKEDTVQRVSEITNGTGADAEFDGAGKDPYVLSLGVVLGPVYRFPSSGSTRTSSSGGRKEHSFRSERGNGRCVRPDEAARATLTRNPPQASSPTPAAGFEDWTMSSYGRSP